MCFVVGMWSRQPEGDEGSMWFSLVDEITVVVIDGTPGPPKTRCGKVEEGVWRGGRRNEPSDWSADQQLSTF